MVSTNTVYCCDPFAKFSAAFLNVVTTGAGSPRFDSGYVLVNYVLCWMVNVVAALCSAAWRCGMYTHVC